MYECLTFLLAGGVVVHTAALIIHAHGVTLAFLQGVERVTAINTGLCEKVNN